MLTAQHGFHKNWTFFRWWTVLGIPQWQAACRYRRWTGVFVGKIPIVEKLYVFRVLFFMVILRVIMMELCAEIGTPLECGTVWWHKGNLHCFNSMDYPWAQITCWCWRCWPLTVMCPSDGPWLLCGSLECPFDVKNKHRIHVRSCSLSARTHTHALWKNVALSLALLRTSNLCLSQTDQSRHTELVWEGIPSAQMHAHTHTHRKKRVL